MRAFTTGAGLPTLSYRCRVSQAISRASWRRKKATSSCAHSGLPSSGSNALSRSVEMVSSLRCAHSECESTLAPPSTRSVIRYRSSSSLPFHAFQTLGLVPRISATVSRYSAVR
ncbi:hypothetical protein D9M68_876740 [compost metagenome]